MSLIEVNLDPTFKVKGGGYVKKHDGPWELFKPEVRDVKRKVFCNSKIYHERQGLHTRVAIGTSDFEESIKLFGVEVYG